MERYCIDHRAAYDMEEIIDNVFVRATEFMHQSSLRMDGSCWHAAGPLSLVLCGWGQELGSLGLPAPVHDRLSLRNPHYRDEEISYSSGLDPRPRLRSVKAPLVETDWCC